LRSKTRKLAQVNQDTTRCSARHRTICCPCHNASTRHVGKNGNFILGKQAAGHSRAEDSGLRKTGEVVDSRHALARIINKAGTASILIIIQMFSQSGERPQQHPLESKRCPSEKNAVKHSCHFQLLSFSMPLPRRTLPPLRSLGSSVRTRAQARGKAND